jgi:uncharacterized membrane protein HdeD (DUF308 family)
MEKKRNTELISSVLYIIIGILLVIFRSETLSWVMTAAGIFFIICGVIDVIVKNFIDGAVSLIIGIAILVLGWTLAKIVLLVFGILIAIKGLILLFEVIQKKKKTLPEIIYPMASVVLGLLLAFGNGLDILIVVSGVLLALDGVVGVFASLKKK